jgi:multidrug efflux system membrane fusion protein
MKRLPLKESLLVVALVIITFATGWLNFGWLTQKTYDAAHPMRGPAVQAVYATGTVEPTVMLPIASRIGARLMTLNADEGKGVRKDDVLAQLESVDLQQSLKDMQARATFAQQDYERKSKLAKQGYVAKSALEQAKAALDSANAAAQAMQAQVGYTKLVAPADGRIIRRDGEIGQMIPANQPVFWLSCCAPLRISAEVDEEDIGLVAPGQNVLIRADAFPNQTFHGLVQSITPKGDPVARSYRVRIGFTEDVPLLIGMTAETNIVVRETKDGLLVPSSAVKQNTVWLVRGGKLAKQAVEIGAKGAEQTEILKGLTVDDVVVVAPDTGFKEGKQVRARLITEKP